jgi:hypothetical protein
LKEPRKLEGAKGGSLDKIYIHKEGAAGMWSQEGVTEVNFREDAR